MRQAVNTQRDEEIRQKRKEGMGLKEIAEKYGISIARAGKICGKTGYIKKREPKEVKPPKDTAKRWVVKSGAAEAYLTKIDCGVFIYAKKDENGDPIVAYARTEGQDKDQGMRIRIEKKEEGRA